jgi:hypothetical protein
MWGLEGTVICKKERMQLEAADRQIVEKLLEAASAVGLDVKAGRRIADTLWQSYERDENQTGPDSGGHIQEREKG